MYTFKAYMYLLNSDIAHSEYCTWGLNYIQDGGHCTGWISFCVCKRILEL